MENTVSIPDAEVTIWTTVRILARFQFWADEQNTQTRSQRAAGEIHQFYSIPDK
jgi:hypothetical protein